MAWTRNEIAARAAREVPDGSYVNLGVGIPTDVAGHLPPGFSVDVHSENGMLGMGPPPCEDEVDADLINASKETVSEMPGSSYFGSPESFAMIRGGHIDLAILGGMEVSEDGDLANWSASATSVKGMGGAMDLVVGARRVIVTMEHVVALPCGGFRPKLRRRCALPLTGARVVDLVVTDLGVFAIDLAAGGMRLTELAPGVTLDEVRAKTEARFEASPCLAGALPAAPRAGERAIGLAARATGPAHRPQRAFPWTYGGGPARPAATA